MGIRHGGRQKGTPNKDSQVLEDKAKALGIDPFEVLLLFAGGKSEQLGYPYPIDPSIRCKAAAEACQYLLPKKKAVELSNKEDEGFRVIVENYIPKNE